MARFLSSILLMAILVGAAFAAPSVLKVDMEHQMLQLHAAVMPKAKLFNPLQSGGGGGPNFGNCSQAVQDQYTQLTKDCTTISTLISVMMSADQVDEDSRKAVDSLCQNSCVVRTINLLINNACLGPEAVFSGKFLQWSCQSNNGMTCGARIAALNPRCSSFTPVQSLCEKRAPCEYVAKNGTTACYQRPLTAATLDTVCGPNSCYDSLMKLQNDVNGPDAGAQKAADKEMMCMKIDKQYCALAIMDAVSSSGTKKMVEELCSDSLKNRCYVRYSGAMSTSYENSARAQFASCMKYNSGTSAQSKNYCLSSLASGLNAADTMRAGGQMLCAKTNATGTSCTIAISQLSSDTKFLVCLGTAMYSDCTASCDVMIADKFKSLGCCAAFVGRSFANPLPEDNRIPANSFSLSFSQINSSYYTKPFQTFSKCSLVRGNITADAYKPCVGKTEDAVSLTVETGMSYDGLNSAGLLNAGATSMNVDLATTMGIDPAFIINGKWRRSTRKGKFKTSGRRATAEQENAAYDFQVAAPDASTNTAAAATFKQQVADGTLSTGSTAALVSTCTSCVDVAATPGSVAVPPPTSSAAPLAAAVILAAAFAVMC